MNSCDCIQPTSGKVTEIILPLNVVDSIWDIDAKKLQNLKKDLKDLNYKITRICEANKFVVI